MPIVRAKKAIKDLTTGDVLEIHATNSSAKSDWTAWANSGGHDLGGFGQILLKTESMILRLRTLPLTDQYRRFLPLQLG